MRLTPEAARRSVEGSLFLFALCVPLTVAGANISWGLVAAGLLACAAAGVSLPWDARRSAIEKPLYLYLGAAALAALLGVDPGDSARYLNKDLHKVWLYLLLSVALAVARPRRPHLPLALGFAAAAAMGIGQILLLPPINPDGTGLRAHAFVHPVTYGEQMAFGLLGACCFLISAQERSKGERAAAILVAVLTGAALLLSKTRMAMVGCAAGLVSVCLLLPRLRRWTLAAASLAAVPFLLSDGPRFEHTLGEELSRWRQTGEFAAQGQLTRVILWSAAWRMGVDHIWTGVGPHGYRNQFPFYYNGDLQAVTNMLGNAHNLYLHQFAERGLIGLAALLALLAAYWRRALQRARSRPDAWNLWAFASANAFLVMNLTEVALQTEIIWMLVFLAWLLAESIHRKEP